MSRKFYLNYLAQQLISSSVWFASHMSGHRQRIGVDGALTNEQSSAVWMMKDRGPIPVEHRSWQLYIPTDGHHIERTVVYLVDEMWATVELYHS